MEKVSAPQSVAPGGWLAPPGVWIMLAFFTALRLFAASRAGLAEDEMYYRLWGLFPSYGYLDHPPMVAWWIAAGQFFVGDNALGIRLLSVVSVLFVTLALHRTAFLLTGSRLLAGRAALWFQAMLLIGVGSVIMTPDSPSVLFWAFSLWAAAELDRSKNPRWLIAMGVFAGLGLQSKYSGLFFGAGFLLWIATDPASRRWWRRPELYLGGLLAVLIVSPVIYWNAQHHWASFAKQFGRAVPGEFTLRYLWEFLGVEFGLLNPLIAILAAVPVVAMIRNKWHAPRPVWFLLAHTLPFTLYLLLHSFHDRVQANWPAPLFPSICLLAVIGSHACETAGRSPLRRLIPLVAPFGIGLSLFILATAIWQVPFLPAKLDITSRTRGWESLSHAVDRERINSNALWIATDKYALTGVLAYGTRDARPQPPVVQITQRLRYASLPTPPASVLQSRGLYVTLDRKDRSTDLRKVFSEVDLVGTYERVVRNRTLGTYRLYRIGSPNDPSLTLSNLSERLKRVSPRR